MVKGWSHFGLFPELVDTNKIFWERFLYRNLEKITRILAILTNDFCCIVCGKYSMQFADHSNLKLHIKNHPKKTVDYWLEHIVLIHPDDLESALNSVMQSES
jgi:hypothetical protein